MQCSIQKPDLLPKNFALLKIVHRTLESEADKNKNIVVLKYQSEQQKFVASKKEDRSLARFLSESPPKDKPAPKSDQIPITLVSQQFKLEEIKPPTAPPVLEMCPQHGRPLELICADDKQRVCAQCALFGSHKGHDVRQEEDVVKEIQLKVEILMEMYQTMHQQSVDMNCSQNYDRHYSQFKKRQVEVKGHIQEKFKEWRK